MRRSRKRAVDAPPTSLNAGSNSEGEIAPTCAASVANGERAGATAVTCCDNDPNALLSCQTNAALNGVEIALIDDLQQAPSPLDLVIASDVLYDRDNFLFLDALPKAASAVLIADSRIKNFQHPRYELLTQQTATTWPDLEEYPEYNHVRVYGSR